MQVNTNMNNALTASGDVDTNNIATGMTITALVGNGNNDNSNDIISNNAR